MRKAGADRAATSDRGFPSWVRYSGVGLELAGATGGLALLGYWLDGRFGTKPWGILGGVVVGLVGGLYNLVRESLDAASEARDEDRDAAAEGQARSGTPAEPGERAGDGR